jgi:hypothetical protein
VPRSFFLVNVVLFVIIGLLGVKLYKTWSRTLEVPALSTQKKSGADGPGITKRKERLVSESAYNVIVEQDLFRPSRTPVKQDATSPQTVSSNRNSLALQSWEK